MNKRDIDFDRLESLVISQVSDETIKEYNIDIETHVHNAYIDSDGEIVVEIPNPGIILFYCPITYESLGGGGGGAGN